MAISKRKRDGRYLVSVWDRNQSKNRYVGDYSTLREAKSAEVEATTRRVSKYSTVGEFAAAWTSLYPRPADSTNAHNAERVRKFAHEYDRTQLSRITADTARAWCLEHKGDHSALRAMFNDAKRSGFLFDNPFSDLRIPKSRGRKDLASEWLTVADVEHLSNTARQVYPGLLGNTVASLITFAAYTGMRPGELFALQREDVRATELDVKYALRKTGTIGPPKNGRPRTIALVGQARAAFDDLPRIDDHLVFTTKTGKMFSASSFHGLWNPVRNTAGRSNMALYELRHFCATFFLEQGLDASTVAVQLGHTDGGALVMSTYGHPSERAARNRILNAAQIAQDGDHGRVRAIGDNL